MNKNVQNFSDCWISLHELFSQFEVANNARCRAASAARKKQAKQRDIAKRKETIARKKAEQETIARKKAERLNAERNRV